MKTFADFLAIRPNKRFLTGKEHEWMASSPPDPRMVDDPYTPRILLDGLKDPGLVAVVNDLRGKQEGIASPSAAGYFTGMPGDGWVLVMGLSEVDPKTGHVREKVPRLIAVFKDRLLVAEKEGELGKFRLNDLGKRAFWVPEGHADLVEGRR